MNVLPADEVDAAEVVMAEREQLVEGAMDRARPGMGIPTGPMVIDPECGIQGHIRKVIARPRCGGAGRRDLIGPVTELEHAFGVPQDVLIVASIAAAECAHV